MMKVVFTLVLSLLFLSLSAQDFEIVSVESLPADMSAREEMKTDHNNRQCALLRIATQNIAPEQRERFIFKSDLGSEVVERASRNGEIWLWVSPGLKYLRIQHPDWGQYELRLIDHVARVEALHTYKVTIKGTMLMALQEQNNNSPTQQYLVFQLSPTNAMLEVDGQLWEVAPDGTAMKFVNFGTYSYRVQAPNYLPETGKVTVDDPNNTKTVNVNLKSDFVEVTLQVDADAEIWVNNEKKGVRTWAGQLGKGTYKIECKKEGHETSMISREITSEMNGKTITLPAPTPIYGSLNVESTPIGATIYIDGREMGKTPRYINKVLIGQHRVRLVKEGYEECSELVSIAKDEHKQMKAAMDKKTEEMQLMEGTTTSNGQSERTFTVNGVSFTMKLIESGTFQMGATSEQVIDAEVFEKPVHSVTLSNYYMGETEVTQALWKAVMGSEPSYNGGWVSDYGKGNEYPAYRVSWNDIQEFLTKLNRLTGKQFRLPTEAEWEYAARGGNKSKGYKYAGSNTIDNVAWYTQTTNDKGTKPVKTKLPNEIGMYDMSGNVWEWCSDWYGNYSSGSQTNPQGPSSGSYRVLRGGSWYYNATYCRVSYRYTYDPVNRHDLGGFRLCLSE